MQSCCQVKKRIVVLLNLVLLHVWISWHHWSMCITNYMYWNNFRIVNRGHYSEKDAALAVKEMLVGTKVCAKSSLFVKKNNTCWYDVHVVVSIKFLVSLLFAGRKLRHAMKIVVLVHGLRTNNWFTDQIMFFMQ